MRNFASSRLFLWTLLALPGLGMGHALITGRADAHALLHPTGEFGVRFMILAMLIGPLIDLLGPRGWLRWLLARRRWLGFAAFLYSLAHLALYVVDSGTLQVMLGELGDAGIWTGWLALLAMAAPGLTSTDTAMRRLRQGWKRLQRLAYPAAILSIAHWVLIEWHWIPALVHLAPLVALNLARMVRHKVASPPSPA